VTSIVNSLATANPSQPEIFDRLLRQSGRLLLARAIQKPDLEGSFHCELRQHWGDRRCCLGSSFKGRTAHVCGFDGRGQRPAEPFLHGHWLAFARGQAAVRTKRRRLRSPFGVVLARAARIPFSFLFAGFRWPAPRLRSGQQANSASAGQTSDSRLRFIRSSVRGGKA
jgi:hypothetical protein